MKLSLVIPAYNEQERLPGTLRRIRAYLDGRGREYEIIVVDDGSKDATAESIREVVDADPRVRLVNYGENRGKGYAVRYGIGQATGDRVLFSDADLSTPVEELERLEPFLEQGYDVAIGSRAIAGANLTRRQSWLRERMGRAFNLAIRMLGVRGIHDSQCGFKVFSRRAAKDVFPQLTVDGWAFDVEALVVAQMLGYRIREVPVTWINSPDSRVNMWRDAARTIGELLRIRLTWMRRRPVRRTEPAAETGTPR